MDWSLKSRSFRKAFFYFPLLCLALFSCKEQNSAEEENGNLQQNMNGKKNFTIVYVKNVVGHLKEYSFKYTPNNVVTFLDLLNKANPDLPLGEYTSDGVYNSTKISPEITYITYYKSNTDFSIYSLEDIGVIVIIRVDHIKEEYILQEHPLLTQEETDSLIRICKNNYDSLRHSMFPE